MFYACRISSNDGETNSTPSKTNRNTRTVGGRNV
jgi:hypothetical protein